MEINEYIQLFMFLILLIALTPILGAYITKVLSGQQNILSPIVGKMETLIYKSLGSASTEPMDWKKYLKSIIWFSLIGLILLFLMLMVQQWLPLNPEHIRNMDWHTALNTSISYITNTNWQSYNGEVELSYSSQMIGLAVQNFLSAATGIAVLIALIRGITNHSTKDLGNFWVDLTRTVLYILLPLAIILAILLVGQGVIQNFNHYTEVVTLQGDLQIIPQGPAASQIAIKQLGTNGGGFFGANSAHPLENPTPFSNFSQMLSILLIPAALTYTYGKMVKSQKQGWAIFAAMFILLIIGITISLYSEFQQNDLYAGLSNMEGKETRFGITNSVLWSTITTAASNGSVNAMHSSLTPLSSMVALINMMLGEVIFGGVGSGLYGILIFVILTVFIAGLMVGRTPEYLGKKIEAFEIKMAMIAVLIPSFITLLFSAFACCVYSDLLQQPNIGAHGLSEILYTFASAAGNNGSAFAGLDTSNTFYNLAIGIGMLIGRFGIIVVVLAIAGSLSVKKNIPLSQGTFRTDNALFVGLLICIIVVIGGLTFFPALSLGPIAEHILMQSNILF